MCAPGLEMPLSCYDCFRDFNTWVQFAPILYPMNLTDLWRTVFRIMWWGMRASLSLSHFIALSIYLSIYVFSSPHQSLLLHARKLTGLVARLWVWWVETRASTSLLFQMNIFCHLDVCNYVSVRAHYSSPCLYSLWLCCERNILWLYISED